MGDEAERAHTRLLREDLRPPLRRRRALAHRRGRGRLRVHHHGRADASGHGHLQDAPARAQGAATEERAADDAGLAWAVPQFTVIYSYNICELSLISGLSL